MSIANYQQIELAEVRGNDDVAPGEQIEVSIQSQGTEQPINNRFAVENRKRSLTFSPEAPDNSPTVLTFENISVSSRTNPPKQLLRGLNGSVTGGFWAIMGPSGGGKVRELYVIIINKANMLYC